MMTAFTVALKAIITNKLRSFLTMLGVIIGVGSVVMLTAIGTGLSAYVTEQFNELGANTILIFPGDVFGDDGQFNSEQQISGIANNKLKLSHIRDLTRERDLISQAAPFNLQATTIEFGSTKKNASAVGSTYELATAYNVPTVTGRFFNKSEDEGADRVIVLGFTLAEELFETVDPIGKRVKLGGQTYTVVGVAEKKGGGFGGPSFDTYAYIPLKASFKQFDTESILRIIVKTKETGSTKASIKRIENVLGKTLEEDEFSVVDQSEILNTINSILGVLTLGLGGIAAISLVVGGIGIMNIMLVSVTERTREIGLRKALGATPNQILLQFLIEAALISAIGGLIGLAIAYAGTLAMQPYFPAQITSQAVAMAVGVSTAVGLIFGAAPARRAAKLSPIEALRYE